MFKHRNRAADYTTNAPSYYDDLARKTELIKILAEAIEKALKEWKERIESFDEDVLLLLRQWLSDGTLEHLINEVLLKSKATIILSETEPVNVMDTTYWYRDLGEVELNFEI